MSTPKPHIRFSYEDFQSLVATSDKRYELLDGDIVMVPSPTATHQEVSRNLGFLLLAHVRPRRLGKVFYAPLDVVFGDGREREVAQPDVLFVSAERRGIIHDDAIRGAPDLVAEILSPGTETRDRGYKKSLYARCGVAEYWIVDPIGKAVEVHALGDAGYALTGRFRKGDPFASPLFPGFALPLDEVFDAE